MKDGSIAGVVKDGSVYDWCSERRAEDWCEVEEWVDKRICYMFMDSIWSIQEMCEISYGQSLICEGYEVFKMKPKIDMLDIHTCACVCVLVYRSQIKVLCFKKKCGTQL